LGNLKDEIRQERPFHSAHEQALLNLIRTADRLNRAFEKAIRPFGVTSTQYNVLRILRGAHPRGLTCSAIGDRMIAAEPDITRLLARLKKLRLVRQHRDPRDRRMLWTRISTAGLSLLREMDPMIERAPAELLGNLSAKELDEFTRLLEKARKTCDGDSTQPDCEGNCKTRRNS
jgi:DNA-binding MarR family transcriptional regulator